MPPPAAPSRTPAAYTPKHLADKILQSKSALEGERKQVTVLFADVQGSMALAAQLGPEQWHQILDRFFQTLEVLFGAPDVEAAAVLAEMHRIAPQWVAGCALREVWFEPTFHKHAKTLCNGLMIHAEGSFYNHHAFRPWRLQALAFKAIRQLYPDYPLWRDFSYEYEFERLAIDVINGGPAFREWVDDRAARANDLDELARGTKLPGKKKGEHFSPIRVR